MRGIIGVNLNPAIASEYGCAFGAFLKRSKAESKKLTVAIGTDSRPSGAMLKAAVTAGLCSVGIDVIDLGLVTTPGVSIMTSHLSCAGAGISGPDTESSKHYCNNSCNYEGSPSQL